MYNYRPVHPTKQAHGCNERSKLFFQIRIGRLGRKSVLDAWKCFDKYKLIFILVFVYRNKCLKKNQHNGKALTLLRQSVSTPAC